MPFLLVAPPAASAITVQAALLVAAFALLCRCAVILVGTFLLAAPRRKAVVQV